MCVILYTYFLKLFGSLCWTQSHWSWLDSLLWVPCRTSMKFRLPHYCSLLFVYWSSINVYLHCCLSLVCAHCCMYWVFHAWCCFSLHIHICLPISVALVAAFHAVALETLDLIFFCCLHAVAVPQIYVRVLETTWCCTLVLCLDHFCCCHFVLLSCICQVHV